MAAQRYDHILMCEGLTQRESDALPEIFVKVDLARVPSLGALAILLDLVGQAISPGPRAPVCPRVQTAKRGSRDDRHAGKR